MMIRVNKFMCQYFPKWYQLMASLKDKNCRFESIHSIFHLNLNFRQNLFLTFLSLQLLFLSLDTCNYVALPKKRTKWVRLININKNTFDMIVNWSCSLFCFCFKHVCDCSNNYKKFENLSICNFLLFRRGLGFDCFLLDIILVKL